MTVVVAWVGILVSAVGIAVGLTARSRAAKAAEECMALARSNVGSTGLDPRAVRDMAIIRYDALEEMAGQLSFSVALLNALGDGMVMTSINGRSETRTYAKIIVGGHGTQELSPEEEQAVRSARLGQDAVRATVTR
ncbi:MAG TPA: DUF4446 family protein [Streptosporangiaceae bacterium]